MVAPAYPFQIAGFPRRINLWNQFITKPTDRPGPNIIAPFTGNQPAPSPVTSPTPTLNGPPTASSATPAPSAGPLVVPAAPAGVGAWLGGSVAIAGHAVPRWALGLGTLAAAYLAYRDVRHAG